MHQVALPPEFQYLEAPARHCSKIDVSKWWWEIDLSALTAEEVSEIAAAWQRIFSSDHQYPLRAWLRESRGGKPLEYRARIISFFIVGAVFARQEVEPFKSLGPVMDISSRKPWRGPPTTCQATRTLPAECSIESRFPGHPFILSHEAASRMERRALSPLEYFRLKALHGSTHYHLHDDFYGDEGKAHQPDGPVDTSRPQRHPTLEQARHSLDDLLDYCFCCDLACDFQRAVVFLRKFDLRKIDAALTARVGNPPHRFRKWKSWEVRIALDMVDVPALQLRWAAAEIDVEGDEVASLAQDSVPILGSAATIDAVLGAVERLRWPNNPPADQPPSYFMLPSSLARNLKDRMGTPMLLELVLELMNRLPPKHWAGHGIEAAGEVLHALTNFSDARVLDWLEEHCREPITYEWGTAAAVNELDWPRVVRWLNAGRPLSLLAVDALANCRPFVAD